MEVVTKCKDCQLF
jgi:hypothetical protein